MQTFHGSLDRSIDRFRIATHFGTRDQALSAIGAKRFLDGMNAGLPTLYEVIIDVPDSNLFKVKKDWGKFGAQGALLPIRELLERDATQEEKIEIAKRFSSHYKRINAISCSTSANCLAEELLLGEANGKYKVVEYDNRVEGSGSGYCVLDPSLITITAITFPPWLEIIEAFKNHGDWPNGQAAANTLQRAIQSGAA